MKIEFLGKAEKEFDRLDKSLRDKFRQHLDKLTDIPPRRHMRFGIPYNVEDITNQARMAYEIEGDVLYVVRCFKSHKEYEEWYSSFK